jgi:cyclopropane-fatty-acyl-phospholipid synthase
LAEERVREAGLEGKIRVHLMDYREIPAEFEKAFDAFVSIEMIEVCAHFVLARQHGSDSASFFQHVGAKHYNTYFKLVDFALKSKGATAVVTGSTFPESRYTGYQ